MRIALVNTRHFRGGGDSTYTFNLAALLRAKGHEVVFFGMQDARNLDDPNSDLFVSHIDFRELNRQRSYRNVLRVLLRAIYSREGRKKFSFFLDRCRPDMVHLQNIHAHITPSVIFEAKARGLPVVWTLHDYKLVCPNSHFLNDRTGEVCEACGRSRYFQPLRKRCKKNSLAASALASLEAATHRLIGVRKRVDVFIAPSQHLGQQLLERGFEGAKVRHAPYCLTEEAFSGPEVPLGENPEPYLLFLGKIEALKGVRELLAACRLRPQIKLVLAGRADETGAKLLREAPPNAKWVGLKHGGALRDLLQKATALVLPSIWWENQPFCILEAFASRKPVIASRLGGMTELVADGERGLLVPPRNPDALGAALEWVVRHPQAAAEMGQRAYTYALANFHPDRHYERLMPLYQEASGTAGGVAPAQCVFATGQSVS